MDPSCSNSEWCPGGDLDAKSNGEAWLCGLVSKVERMIDADEGRMDVCSIEIEFRAIDCTCFILSKQSLTSLFIGFFVNDMLWTP